MRLGSLLTRSLQVYTSKTAYTSTPLPYSGPWTTTTTDTDINSGTCDATSGAPATAPFSIQRFWPYYPSSPGCSVAYPGTAIGTTNFDGNAPANPSFSNTYVNYIMRWTGYISFPVAGTYSLGLMVHNSRTAACCPPACDIRSSKCATHQARHQHSLQCD